MARRQPGLESAPPAGTVRATALTLLSRRDYTTAELRSKLADKGYDTETIDVAVAELTSQHLLDDRRSAAAHVRRAAAIKGRGRVRISRELAARGLSREIIDEALAAVARDDEMAAIRRILSRKRWPANPSRLERQGMYRHLLGRGFPADLIGRALGRHDEDDAD
ncbi:MAG TPA: regulatory protein RecX [Vicinamibacterales bacterium]|nr:regulatory protein RecX [Vicinamibacterales bacterium]